MSTSAAEPKFQIDFGSGSSVSLPLNISQSSIFPVVHIKNNRMRSIGTCFAISNHGLCLTAKHVIDDVPSIPMSDRHTEVDGNLGIIYIDPTADEDGVDLFGGFMPLNMAHSVPEIDLAVMHISLPVHVETGEFIPFPLQRMTLDFPRSGEQIVAFGYEKGEWEFDEPGVHTLSQTFTASKGRTCELHPSGRDSAFMPSPCFQTSAEFRSGMSGGPVINDSGLVVGVVSTGFEIGDGDEPISYATPIAPSMGIPVRGADSAGNASNLFLWDFAVGGAIKVDAGSAKVTRSEGKLLIKVSGGEYRSLLPS